MTDKTHNDYSRICYFSPTHQEVIDQVHSPSGLAVFYETSHSPSETKTRQVPARIFYQDKNGVVKLVTNVFDPKRYKNEQELQQAIQDYTARYPDAEKVFDHARLTATPPHLIQQPPGQKPGTPLKKVFT